MIFLTLNNTFLKKIEFYLPFKLTPEQKSILLLWFGADSKFGWSKLDFLVGVHRVRRLYPDHRGNVYKDHDGLPYDPCADFIFDCDGSGNPVIRFYEDIPCDEEDIPF